jgi:hypothetical protein
MRTRYDDGLLEAARPYRLAEAFGLEAPVRWWVRLVCWLRALGLDSSDE